VSELSDLHEIAKNQDKEIEARLSADLQALVRRRILTARLIEYQERKNLYARQLDAALKPLPSLLREQV
jgi:hypothetical protein